MPGSKIACLGGGSRYFARVLGDLAVTPGLAESEITLYDIDLEKAELMAKHGARLAEQSGTGLRVRACRDLADAVDGADFALSSIGGAGKSRGGIYGTQAHREDVRIPAKYGIYQCVGDTGGPAGMMMAFRSIPIYLDICREMQKRCPQAVLVNHSNPMAILCRAMIKYGGVPNVIGICHGVQAGIKQVAEILGVSPLELDTIWIGTNHYYWFTRIRHGGRDVYPELRRKLQGQVPPEGGRMSAKLSEIYGHQLTYPHDSHAIEFYPFPAQAGSFEKMPYGMNREIEARFGDLTAPPPPEPSEEEARAAEREALREFAKSLDEVTLPEEMSDPILGEGTGALIQNIALGRRAVHIVNIPNEGAVPNLPRHAVLEVEGVTDSCGVRPLHMGEAPLALMGMLQKRIAWQELVVEAGVKGDRDLALQALMLDEMAIVPEKAEAMLDELLAASRNLLPQFA